MTLTDHARWQIDNRSTLTEDDVKRYVSDFSIPIAKQPDGREHLLFFAPEERTFYIAVRALDQAIITFMPYDFKARTIGVDALKMARKKHDSPKVNPPPNPPAKSQPKCLIKIQFRAPLFERYLGPYHCQGPYRPEELVSDETFRAWMKDLAATDKTLAAQCASQPRATVTCHRKDRSTDLGMICDLLS